MLTTPFVDPRPHLQPRKSSSFAGALFALLLPALAFAQSPASDDRQSSWDQQEAQRLERCLSISETDAEAAFEEGLAWRSNSGGLAAEHCVAAAMVARGQVEEGANLLVALANAPDGGPDRNRALLLSKAANAFLLIGEAETALVAIDRALELAPGTRDLVSDRAVALAFLDRWQEAEQALDAVMTETNPDATLYRLRAEARLQQGKVDLADLDVAEAIRLAPEDIENYVVRGRAREARRLGRPPD